MTMFTPSGEGGRPTAGRRGRAGCTVVVLLLISAVAGGSAWWWDQHGRTTTTAGPKPTCPAAQPTLTAVAAHDIRLNVYNATDRVGLAGRVGKALRKRGFTVATISNDPVDRAVAGVAEVRASTTGSARLLTVGAQVSSYVAVADQRESSTVDLVLGPRFHGLRSRAAARAATTAALAPSPAPLPAGCKKV
jgi:LytR cell envelope-related transcriptional attenuator